MTRRVRLRDGIEITFTNGERFVMDGDGGEERNATTLVSHAHGDHFADATEVVASELTAALLAARQEEADPKAIDHPAVERFPAGHVAGSRAMRLTDPDTGRRYLYTGDCSTRDRLYLDGFEPVDADVLILETTYGTPEYRFPPTAESIAEIQSWLTETMDEVVLLFGYALGRAQKLQYILGDSGRERVFVTDAIATSSCRASATAATSTFSRATRSSSRCRPRDSTGSSRWSTRTTPSPPASPGGPAPTPIPISVHGGTNIDRLTDAITARLPTERAELRLRNCDDAMGVVSQAYDRATVESVEYEPETVRITVTGRPQVLAELRAVADEVSVG